MWLKFLIKKKENRKTVDNRQSNVFNRKLLCGIPITFFADYIFDTQRRISKGGGGGGSRTEKINDAWYSRDLISGIY